MFPDFGGTNNTNFANIHPENKNEAHFLFMKLAKTGSKPCQGISAKKSSRPMSFMNINAKILNKIFVK
jgi:hypothetical protein